MKEWKGNSASAKVLTGIKTKNSNSDRGQDDYYATDPEALKLFFTKSS